MDQQSSNHYIRLFTEIGATDVASVGGKGANLGEMTQTGMPVPPGFCITAEAYRAFIQSTGAAQTIRSLVSSMRPDDPEQVESASAQIRDYLVAQPVPPEIAGQVVESYRRLAQTLGGEAEPRVAVRSSATAEDLPTASFAGQQDTYLNIRGETELLAHVKRCWASLWTARAVAYRARQGFEHDKVALAVVVQAMIAAQASGILFTANPVTGERGETVVNASWGLGEAIVAGIVTPDTWIVRRQDGVIVSREIARKDIAIGYAPQGGTAEVALPLDKQNLPALEDSQVSQLVRLGDRIAQHYGTPMDIEWAYAADTLYVLQARAITTLADARVGADTRGEYNRTMFIEIFPDPLSPIFLSAIQPLFHAMLDFTFRTLGFRPPANATAVAVFHNQPYFSRDYIESALNPLPPAVRERMVQQIMNPFGAHERGIHTALAPSYVGMMSHMLRFMLQFPSQLPGVLAEWRAKIREEESLSIEGLPDRAIYDRIYRLVFSTTSSLLNYDFLMIALIGITYQTLGSLLERYFGNESEEIRSRLISGVTGNMTMEANIQLWDLAASAKRAPAVASVLCYLPARDVRSALAQSPEGVHWLTEFDAYLSKYGHREVRMDILYPTWGEDPAPVLAFLRSYLDLDESASPRRQQERLVAEREELARMVQTRLRTDWTGRLVVGPLFRWILKQTQVHTRERDTMHFELTRLFPPYRRFLLELGTRWTERGFLTEPTDIFFLTMDEVSAMADAPTPLQTVVSERRVEFAKSKEAPAPGILRDGIAVQSAGADVPEGAANRLQGIAGSPGRVTGIARVICGPEEFHKLQSGDILVAPITNPVWTPLFAIAGGIITEVGGILSHGAIVAREYGIPAVMAVAGATSTLRDGQRVTLDGGKGVVLLQPDAGE